MRKWRYKDVSEQREKGKYMIDPLKYEVAKSLRE